MSYDDNITQSERKTQEQVLRLVKDRLPDYKYIGNLKEVENTNLREDSLMVFLTKRSEQKLTSEQAKSAIRKLKEEIAMCSNFETLMETSEKVYERLCYGVSIHRGLNETDLTVHLVDWDNPKNNIFEIAEEVTVRCDGLTVTEHRRPDIVVYINGIAMVVLELKRQGVPVAEGIRQNYRNQQSGYIPQFFTTSQLCMAGNPSEGLFYGTTCTPQKHYLHWKEPTGISDDEKLDVPTFADVQNELDRSVLQMLEPTRLIHFIQYCVIYDGGTKKVARPNQFFALRAAIPRIERKDSGIIWHSQGSGKSLTMVWLAKWIKQNVENARVVIITDRDELDKQITNGLRNSGLLDLKNHEIGFYHAKSGNDLLTKLDATAPWLITTLIHKFGAPSDKEDLDEYQKIGKRSIDQYLKEVAEKLPVDFKAKGNLFVFIDECHRTQGGMLHKAMRMIMGENVMMIGFTGTPLLKKGERVTSQENIGRYIHSYRFDEAVKDGVILDLRYEARNVEKELQDADRLNALFEVHTRQLTPKAKEALKDRWAQLQNIYSSDQPMRRVVADILFDMETKPALTGGYGNAMLVCESIYEAYKYWSLFKEEGFANHCAVVSSYEPDINLASGFAGEKKTEEELKYKWSKEMMGERTPEQFEEWAKDQFINRPAEMKLLIVVDKLLTGFDAPTATYLYLDRKMIDHNLFQAICRVNRLNGEEKEFGFIVDYRGLFNFIEDAIESYTNGETTEGFQKEEIAELLQSRLKKGREELEKALQNVERLSEPVELPRKLDNFFDYFCFKPNTPADEQSAEVIRNATKREDFYNAVNRLSRRYAAIAMEMEEAGFTKEEAESIYWKVKDYDELRHALMQRSGDYVDMKLYDAQMRSLLDRYIVAPRSEKLVELNDFSFLDIISINEVTGDVDVDEQAEQELGGQRGVAETMTANVRRVVNRKREQNPEEYRLFSDRINRLLEELRQGVIEYKEFLMQIKKIGEELKQGNVVDARLDTAAKRNLCDNLGGNIELTLRIYATAKQFAQPRFRQNMQIKKQLLRQLEKALKGEDFEAENILGIITAHTIEFPD